MERPIQQQFSTTLPWSHIGAAARYNEMPAPSPRPCRISHAGKLRGAILVVTDMQQHFAEASEPRLLQNVCHLIDVAIAEERPIAVLEWEGWGATLEPIRQRLAGYGNHFTVLKQTDGGAQKLLGECEKRDLRTFKWIVCGVSINACVKETVCGLAFSYGHPSVDVITEACADHFPPRWDEFPEASNVRLLPTLM